jgi:hypothetical protein
MGTFNPAQNLRNRAFNDEMQKEIKHQIEFAKMKQKIFDTAIRIISFDETFELDYPTEDNQAEVVNHRDVYAFKSEYIINGELTHGHIKEWSRDMNDHILYIKEVCKDYHVKGYKLQKLKRDYMTLMKWFHEVRISGRDYRVCDKARELSDFASQIIRMFHNDRQTYKY